MYTVRIRLPNKISLKQEEKKNMKARKLGEDKEISECTRKKKKNLKHVFMLVVRAQLWIARGKGYTKSARPLI